MKMNVVYLALFTLLIGSSPALANSPSFTHPEPQCPDQHGQTGQCDTSQDDQNGQTDYDHPDQSHPDQDHPHKKKHPHGKVRYNWGQNQFGFGYCYAFDKHGHVLYNGHPQPNAYCERVRPSHYNWGRAANGYIYCYQWSPYWNVLNDGRPVHPNFCHY